MTCQSRERPIEDRLGVCQWFHYEDHAAVDRCIRLMRELGVKHLRTGVSWADYLRPGGRAWYDWQMAALAEFEVLLSVWHTPPSLGEKPLCNAPPRRLQDYADFIDVLITDYGDLFTHLELWNEPNNRMKWAFDLFDPEWAKFGEMIAMAAYWAKQRGKPTVLGGMIPVDDAWLRLMNSHGALNDIDIIAVHGFPGMWWPDAPNWDWRDHWHGWEEKVQRARLVRPDLPVWITETGLSTVDPRTREPANFAEQGDRLRGAAAAPADRVYWYSMIDLDPARDAIEGFHVDENEYHLGLVTFEGERKPAFEAMRALLAGRVSRAPVGRPPSRASNAAPRRR